MSNEPKTLYLAGPMSGIPQFNFPLFNTAAHALRNQGYRIISPAETDHEQTRAMALASPDGASGMEGAESWGDCLARDVKMLADGFPVDTDESDADFRARMKAATKAWLKTNPPDEHGAVVPRPPFVRTVTRSQLKIDGVALLPGWENSRGARLEAFVSLDLGKEFFTVEELVPENDDRNNTYGLAPVTPEWVQHMLAKRWADAIQMHKPIP